MEELHPEDDVKNFAQISKKMAWKDTIDLLLDEKKFEEYIKNLAKQDMDAFLSDRLKRPRSDIVREKNNGVQINIRRQYNIFSDIFQNHKYKHCMEQARKRALRYRAQIINECKRLDIDFETDKNLFEKIQNENLNPPIPISDWHYNIQFLKPDFNNKNYSSEDDMWEEPVRKYINDGIEANNNPERCFFYFKVIDKETGKNVGIARICTKAKEFVINYDRDNRPVKLMCVGDPGLFLDPSCQGSCKGSEIYATTLNVLYNFLLSDNNKSQKTVIKCNRLNRASRKLQKSIGAVIANEDKPIDRRFYYIVQKEDILRSKCVSKLAKLGLDTYTITIDEKTYKVSLRDGILSEEKITSSFSVYLQA